MKKKIIITAVILGVIICVVSGMVLQRFYGLGNLMKAFNKDYVQESKRIHLKKNHENRLSIFILAGQSNMEGDGMTSEFNKNLYKDGLYVFNEDYKWVIGREPVQRKVGPTISFMSHLENTFKERPIGALNVAVGGTNLAEWEKDGDDNSLYQKMLKRSLAASAQGRIEGLLFFQGENDAEGDSTDYVNNWHIHFEQFVKDFRQDIGIDSLPVIYAQIGKSQGKTWEAVKESQEKVSLVNCVMIKSDDIDFQEGNIHYTTAGYTEIGRRFAQSYKEHFATWLEEGQ